MDASTFYHPTVLSEGDSQAGHQLSTVMTPTLGCLSADNTAIEYVVDLPLQHAIASKRLTRALQLIAPSNHDSTIPDKRAKPLPSPIIKNRSEVKVA